MSTKAWLILWALLLVGSLVIWVWVLLRTYRSFRGLRKEVQSLIGAANSVKFKEQTRLKQNVQAPNEEERR